MGASIISSSDGRDGRDAPERKEALSEAIRQTRSALTKLEAFESFWKRTICELEALDPAVESELDQRRPYRQIELHNTRFRSWNGVRVAGYRLFWKDDQPRPLVVHGHGYNSRYSAQWLWALAGLERGRRRYPQLRPFPEGRGAALAVGFMLTGFESPEARVLRGAVCDYIQAVRVGRAAWRARGQAPSCSAASVSRGPWRSWLKRPRNVPICSPSTTFEWHDGRNELAQASSAIEVRRFRERQPHHAATIRDTLRYFDSMNFAPMIRSPTLLGIGRRDIVVPPATVYAIRNRFDARWKSWSSPSATPTNRKKPSGNASMLVGRRRLLKKSREISAS